MVLGPGFGGVLRRRKGAERKVERGRKEEKVFMRERERQMEFPATSPSNYAGSEKLLQFFFL